MKLYFSPGACALSPQIALREAGLDFELVKVNLKEKKYADGGDYWAVNPKGSVPALEIDGGKVLTEGPAIVQYIADQAPQKKLAPANGTWERAKLQEMLNFITSELHKGYSPLFNPATPEEYKAMAKENLKKKYAYVDGILAKQPYLLGEEFTVADGYLFNVSRWAGHVGFDLAPYANLGAFMERMNARPAVKEALAAEAA